MDNEWVKWAIGILFTLFLLLDGYLWKMLQDQAEAFKQVRGEQVDECKLIRADIAKVSERVSAIEVKAEPFWEVCKVAIPQMLQLHRSPDVLAEALEGEPDENKIALAEEKVAEYQERNGTTIPVVLAIAMLQTRRRELEQRRTHEGT